MLHGHSQKFPLREPILKQLNIREFAMAEQKTRELMARNNITIEDLRERKHTLHHLRNVVRSEEMPFDVFRTLVMHRR